MRGVFVAVALLAAVASAADLEHVHTFKDKVRCGAVRVPIVMCPPIGFATSPSHVARDTRCAGVRNRTQKHSRVLDDPRARTAGAVRRALRRDGRHLREGCGQGLRCLQLWHAGRVRHATWFVPKIYPRPSPSLLAPCLQLTLDSLIWQMCAFICLLDCKSFLWSLL